MMVSNPQHLTISQDTPPGSSLTLSVPSMKLRSYQHHEESRMISDSVLDCRIRSSAPKPLFLLS